MTIIITEWRDDLEWFKAEFAKGPVTKNEHLPHEEFVQLHFDGTGRPVASPLMKIQRRIEQATGETLQLWLSNVTRQEAGCTGRTLHVDNNADDRRDLSRSAVLYLGGSFDGGDFHMGETALPWGGMNLVRPKRGLLISFPATLPHGSRPVTSGERLRVDMFFRPAR